MKGVDRRITELSIRGPSSASCSPLLPLSLSPGLPFPLSYATMLHVQNVAKSYRRGSTDVEVLRGVSCEIGANEFVFIVGPSGSGKSTLLYLLGALDEPSSGTITVDGRALGEWSTVERDRFRRDEVGFVFQSFNLLDNLSAVDNVLVPELPRGVGRDRRAAAEELLRQVGLGERIEHRPKELSGGEQQRVAIARALLKRPRLVLADEPTGELDTENGRQVFEYLRTLQREQGSTVVTVTHDEQYIEAGDRVLEIRDGRFVDTSDVTAMR